MAVFCLLALPACLPEAPLPTAFPPTGTPTAMPTETVTIVWFPPTATFTPLPTIQISPTPDVHPTLGPVLFTDPFTDQTQWQTTRTAAGSIAYGEGSLTLAVSAKDGTLISLRKTPQLSDFYLEIDATPSLCRGNDAYGLLLRASSHQDFYRLMVTCNGQVRLERMKNSRVTPLQNWTPSGQLMPGGMLPAHLAVLAEDQLLSIYVNGVIQFSVKDPVFRSGALGVFARSAGDTPLTVNFSNLAVYAAGSAQPMPTRAPIPNPLPTATVKP